jgi:glycosyltransferase involved in cell wall biosynthesis
MGLGGAEKMLVDICFEMHRRGHLIKVISLHPHHFSFDKYSQKKKFLSLTSFEIVKMNTSIRIFPPGIKVESTDYIRILREFKPDVIHSHLFQAELLSHSYHHKNAVYFSHMHDNMFQLESWKRRARRRRKWTDFFERTWIIRRYVSFQNNFIAISKDTFDFCHKVLPQSLQNNILLIKNAIHYDSFRFNEERKISPNRFIRLVSVGNLVPKKNHQLLIRICSELKKRGLQFQCDILGFGILLEELNKQIETAGLQDCVFLRGSVPNVAEYMKQADVYVHPANYEPFGLVILEAMASGLPVVCRNGQGNLDIHEEGITGFMIDGDYPEAFAEKIEALINDPVLYGNISAYNRKYSQQYDISHYGDKLEDVYQNARERK